MLPKEENKKFVIKEEKSGFQVPEGYFEKLSDEVWATIATSDPKVTPFHRRIHLATISKWMIAASMTGLLFWFGYTWTNDYGQATSLNNISEAEALEYVEINLQDFEEELLISTLETPEG